MAKELLDLGSVVPNLPKDRVAPEDDFVLEQGVGVQGRPSAAADS